MPKKILFLAYYYPPAGGIVLPGTQRSVRFVRYLEDIDKYVLTVKEKYYPNFIALDTRDTLPVNDEKIIRTGTLDIFNFFLIIKNLPIKLFKFRNKSHTGHVSFQSSNKASTHSAKKTFFSKLKDAISGALTYPDPANHWIVPAFLEGRRQVKKNKINYIFATGKPWSSLIAGWMISLTTDVKLIVDFRDPWVNNPFSNENNRFRNFIGKKIEKNIVKKAEFVFLNTEELRQEFAHRYPVSIEKLYTVPNGYDVYDFEKFGIEREQESQYERKLLLTHAGFLYGLRDPKPILEALIQIKKSNPKQAENIIFHQIGETTLDYDLSHYIRENSLENNYINLGQLNYAECLKKMRNSDVLLIIQPNTMTQIPSKLYEYLYLNKQILTISQKNGALGNLIIKYKFGNIFEDHETTAISKYILNMLEEKQNNLVLKVNYKNRYHFNIKLITHALENLIT